MYSCCECGKILVSQRVLTNHLRTNHPNTTYATKVFQCGHCFVAFSETKNLLRHLRSQHNMNESHRCPAFPTIFDSLTTLNEDEETVHLKKPLPTSQSAPATVEFTSQVFNSHFQIQRMKLEDSGFIDPFNCLMSFKNEVLAFINSNLQVGRSVGIGISIGVGVMKPLLDETTEAYFNSSLVSVSLECVGKPNLLKAQFCASNTSDSTTIPLTVQNWQITSQVPDSTDFVVDSGNKCLAVRLSACRYVLDSTKT